MDFFFFLGGKPFLWGITSFVVFWRVHSGSESYRDILVTMLGNVGKTVASGEGVLFFLA